MNHKENRSLTEIYFDYFNPQIQIKINLSQSIRPFFQTATFQQVCKYIRHYCSIEKNHVTIKQFRISVSFRVAFLSESMSLSLRKSSKLMSIIKCENLELN